MSGKAKYLAAAAVVAAGSGFAATAVMGGRATAEPPLPDSAVVQARADAVFAAFNGTRIERDAGAVLQAYSLNHGLDECMATEGFPAWDWSLPRAQNPESRGLESSRVFAPPLSHAVSTGLMASADSIRADAAARKAVLPAAELEAVKVCFAKTPAVADSDAPTSPLAAGELRDAWWKMLGELDQTYGDLDGYSECLMKSSIRGLPEVSSRDQAVEALSSLQPAAADLPSGATDVRADASRWGEFIAVETAWEAADWACRGSAYNAHIADVGMLIEEFAQENAQQIAEARRGWEGIAAEAKELGYLPGTYGPIGAE